MIAIIPVTANLAICALLGSSSGYYRMFVGTIMALILVIWISARWKLLELGRWLSSVVIVVLSRRIGDWRMPRHRSDRTICATIMIRRLARTITPVR